MKRAKKIPSEEFMRRVKETLSLMAVGHTRPELLRHAAEKWGIKERQAETYMIEARKELREHTKAEMVDIVASIGRNRWLLFRESLRKGDLNCARAVLSDMAKMHGIDQDQVRLSFGEGARQFQDLPDDELERMLAGST